VERVLTAADSRQRGDQTLCGPNTGPADVAQVWDVDTGRRFVTTSNDGSARLWDPFTGDRIGEPILHQSRA